MVRSALLLAAVSVALLLAPGRSAAGPIYLALGDSSAFGETNRTRNPSDGDRGYVSRFADSLATRYGVRPGVINLALNGETTTSWLSGTGRASSDGHLLNTNYAPPYPAQRELFRARVAAAVAAGHTFPVVTVQLGANDLYTVAEAPGFLALSPAEQQAAVLQQFGRTQQDYAAVLTEVRSLLPDAELYVIGYHNPYGGSPDHPFHPLAAPAVQGVNQIAAGMAGAFGGTYVDFYTPVLGREQELTLVTTDDPANNMHLNDQGYAVVAGALIQTATATPEPATLTLVGLGLAGVAGLRLRRRVAA